MFFYKVFQCNGFFPLLLPFHRDLHFLSCLDRQRQDMKDQLCIAAFFSLLLHFMASSTIRPADSVLSPSGSLTVNPNFTIALSSL